VKLAIIANPWAGRGRARSIIDEFRSGPSLSDWDVSIDETRAPGDGVRLAERLAREADVLGIIGGDGTIHEAVNGLMPDPIPIVILPAGTGNDYASLIRCPTGVQEMSEVLGVGYGATLDVLDFGDRFCLNSAGLGFEGLVNRRSHNIRRIPGPLLYLTAVFQTLARLECPRFKITTPETQEIEGEKLLVSIGNGNRTGGAFYLTPDAVPDDGLIDVCVVNAMSWPRVVRLLPMSFSGKHVTRPEVRMMRVKSLAIETSPDFPMHIDGELIESAPRRLTITVRHRVLPVLCKQHQQNRLLHPLQPIL
jgi:diacylglycerol kinase (ATP)